MSYVVERLEVTDEERQAARRELDELVDRYGRELLPPYLAGRFGREVELSAIAGRPVRRETAVLYLIYDTEYRQVSDSPSREGGGASGPAGRSPATAHLDPADAVPILFPNPDGTSGTLLAGDLRALAQYIEQRDGEVSDSPSEEGQRP